MSNAALDNVEPREPETLGEALTSRVPVVDKEQPRGWIAGSLLSALNIALLTIITTTPLWWVLMRPEIDLLACAIVGAVLGGWGICSVLTSGAWQGIGAWRGNNGSEIRKHLLLVHDTHGIMRDLRLDAKTVIIDGSNIYHFGHENGVDAQPLGLIANQLRAEGYRVVCFFDANIFYTLRDHGAFATDQRHDLKLLEDIFGLRGDEIYVVPGGMQADRFVLSSLKHLPISFAVSNDQFRDYAKMFSDVMTGDQWRKGVSIVKGEVRLFKFGAQSPMRLY